VLDDATTFHLVRAIKDRIAATATSASASEPASIMDWARDNAGISDKDLDNVFRYEEKPATVVRMLVGKKVQRPNISNGV